MYTRKTYRPLLDFGKIIVLIIFLSNQSSNAQDAHFSQVEYAPLLLNPALVGTKQDLHATLNYKNQWRAATTPFSASYASLSYKLTNKTATSGWQIAVGFDALNDKSGEPTLITNAINFHLGSRVQLSQDAFLTAGIFAGYRQISINPTTGQWASQFNGTNYDASLNSGEKFSTLECGGFNSGLGIIYGYSNQNGQRVVSDHKEFSTGIAVYNLNRPDNSFLHENADRLAMRFTVFTKGEFRIPNRNMSLMPGIYYQRQGTHQELLLGSYLNFHLRQPSKYAIYTNKLNLAAGLFYRYKDAFCIKSFIEWSDFKLGIAYDVNTSSLRYSTHSRGGLELFFNYSIRSLQQSKSRRGV